MSWQQMEARGNTKPGVGLSTVGLSPTAIKTEPSTGNEAPFMAHPTLRPECFPTHHSGSPYECQPAILNHYPAYAPTHSAPALPIRRPTKRSLQEAYRKPPEDSHDPLSGGKRYKSLDQSILQNIASSRTSHVPPAVPPSSQRPHIPDQPVSHALFAPSVGPGPFNDCSESFDTPPLNKYRQPNNCRRDSHNAATSAATSAESTSTSLPLQSANQRRRSIISNTLADDELESPFKDCLKSFGTFKSLEFGRPNNDCVDGYVKFRWASKPSQIPSISQQTSVPDGTVALGLIANTGSSSNSVTTIPGDGLNFPVASTLRMTGVNVITQGRADWPFSLSYQSSQLATDSALSRPGGSAPFAYSAVQDAESSMLIQTEKPRMLPPQFGFQGKMETEIDRKFWEFYIQNWCPGRTILHDTNLWLNDFGRMHENEGVRAAIQCLAGVYIYDYVPQPRVIQRVNELFEVAENRLTKLLNDPTGLKADDGRELITISVILSMQDIVLTERRRKMPNNPRWLEGFYRAEYALRVTDPGSRFWKKENVQLTSLRKAQTVMVGRAMIIANIMMKLTPSIELDPQKEVDRFSWLLYGTEEDMFAIHGGCGFSKKLLHVLSQVTYCAARLRQDPESPIPPMTAGFLITELHEMKQWNSESMEWSQLQHSPQTIEWVRAQPTGFIIDTAEQMTDVTAEAWRVAAIVYTQCRALRLPRDHAKVVANLTDLAKCIRIMPTSGTLFTAQAPLLPVFLLGVTATLPEHEHVSEDWFEQVLQIPVRSSVPPLFKALPGIRSWIDEAVPLSAQPIPESVAMRDPWWERLVERVPEIGEELLCLT